MEEYFKQNNKLPYNVKERLTLLILPTIFLPFFKDGIALDVFMWLWFFFVTYPRMLKEWEAERLNKIKWMEFLGQIPKGKYK